VTFGVARVLRSLRILLPLLVSCAGPAGADGFSGYLRLGAGRTVDGGSQACFQLPGAPVKYRLGNECEAYGEFELAHEIDLGDQGTRLSLDGMASVYNAYRNTPLFDGDEGFVRVPQAWASLTLPALRGASIWAGRRYYKRHDIHISDFYYWNPTGTGGGVEDYRLGGMTASYMFSFEDNAQQEHRANRHDLNLGNIATNRDGAVEVGLSLIQPGDVDGAHGGWSLSAEHRQRRFAGGENRLVAQYGVGPGTGLGQTGNLTSGRHVRRWRALESVLFQATRRLGGMVLAVVERSWSPDRDETWYSAGARAAYALTDHVKLATGVGHDRIRSREDGLRMLTKFTVSPALSIAPEFMSRPELRAYYTYATWNQAARQAAADGTGLASDGAFGGDHEGANFGIQLETWW
jgi:maltoporin